MSHPLLQLVKGYKISDDELVSSRLLGYYTDTYISTALPQYCVDCVGSVPTSHFFGARLSAAQ